MEQKLKKQINQIFNYLIVRKSSIESQLDDIYSHYPRNCPFPAELDTEYRVVGNIILKFKKYLDEYNDKVAALNYLIEELDDFIDGIEAFLRDIYTLYPVYPKGFEPPVVSEIECRVSKEILFEIKKIFCNGDNTDETGSDK